MLKGFLNDPDSETRIQSQATIDQIESGLRQVAVSVVGAVVNLAERLPLEPPAVPAGTENASPTELR